MRLGLALFYVILLYVIIMVLDALRPDIAGFAALTGYPVLYGMVVQSLIDPRAKKPGFATFRWGLLPLGIVIAGLLFWDFETLICVAITALPFLLFMGLGVWIARLFLQSFTSRFARQSLNASLVLMPLPFIPLLDSLPFPERDIAVASEVVIEAPPDTVWFQLMDIPEIQESERIWTFSHHILNAPEPVDAVLDGRIRQLRWTKGVRFQEHISERVKDRFLAWRFVFNEPETLARLDPHISPDGRLLALHSGFYRLELEEDGSTRLHLETHYRLATPMNAYLEIWGGILLQDFHRAVLAVVKARSEQRVEIKENGADFPG